MSKIFISYSSELLSRISRCVSQISYFASRGKIPPQVLFLRCIITARFMTIVLSRVKVGKGNLAPLESKKGKCFSFIISFLKKVILNLSKAMLLVQEQQLYENKYLDHATTRMKKENYLGNICLL